MDSYAYPRSFPKGLVDLMAEQPKVLPYLDMPLQHIANGVLKAMRRGTNSDAIRKRVQELRARAGCIAQNNDACRLPR